MTPGRRDGRGVLGPAGGGGPPAPDFTIVPLPDTQHYVDSAAREFQFGAQTQWIVDNGDDLNTEFVTHSGDIVEHIDQFEQEWIYADQHGQPGQHRDPEQPRAGKPRPRSTGAANFFDQYFPPSR